MGVSVKQFGNIDFYNHSQHWGGFVVFFMYFLNFLDPFLLNFHFVKNIYLRNLEKLIFIYKVNVK